MSHGYTAWATFALEVPPGDILISADKGLMMPATVQLTMAAIDPTEEPMIEDDQTAPRIPRSTLKMVRLPPSNEWDSDDEDNEDLTDEQLAELRRLVAENSDDDSDDGYMAKAGPSDRKKKSEAGLKKLAAATKADAESDEEMADDEPAKVNGVKKNKGKAKASIDEEDDSESESDDEDNEPDVAVICTLDTERTYQQPLNIILPMDESIGFVVSGTHPVFLTGNIVTHPDEEHPSHDEDSEDYDMEPDSDELIEDDSDEESDILDAQRITEVDSDEEEAPKLVAAATKKTSKKRPAEEEAESLDNMIEQEQMTKGQLKKLNKKMKNNKGEPVATEEPVVKETKKSKKAEEPAKVEKSDKKVRFAKKLEQGPTGSEAQKANDKTNNKPSVTTVKGVTIDDRKAGKGRVAKPGDKVGVRYIGKLQNGKVFDANKKGPAFTFKVGKGEVIKGWDIGVQGMAVGGERRLVVPPHMAYASSNLPGIPANSTLVFDVKLLEIK